MDVGNSLASSLAVALRTWLIPRRYGVMRWSYTLQRISGVAITLYFVAHIVETGNVVGGAHIWMVPAYQYARDVWTETVEFLANPLFDAGLTVIGFLVFFHTVNGLRLFLAHFGIILGKPHRPEYPYIPASMTRLQIALFWLSIALAVAALLYSVNIFFKVI
jgi:succinate dehydrogenase / fumarate reductase cytochrome b subunit